jgi:predicted RND superfamily exporter protein
VKVPLNPISAAIGAILIAFGAALGSLLYARYAASRETGQSPVDSLAGAWSAAGADAALPALVLGAGFLALTASDFDALNDFGVVGLAGLAFELIALVLVLPATLRLAEDGVSLRIPSSRAEFAGLARGAGRRARLGLAGAGRVARAAAAGVRRAAPSRK